MKNKVFYFTGTGNSLWIARELASRLENSEISALLNSKKKGLEDAETVGVVFPVYMHRMPRLVADFIKTLPALPYLYAVAVNAGDIGQAFTYFRKQLEPQPQRLKAGFSIVTPSNYLPFGEAAQGEKQDLLFDTARAKLDRISRIIMERKIFFDRERGFFAREIHPGLLYAMGYRYLSTLDRNFSSDKNCTGCGICTKVCPVGNISLKEDRPVWNRNCQLCFACINLCPESSIQYGKKTKGLKRYRNPEVSVADIINQKNG